MRVLVTGGAGFVGSHLVEALVARGDRVRVLDDLSSGKRDNLAGVIGEIELVQGDIRNPETCRTACSGIERVWHLAAMVSVTGSVEDPQAAHDINSGGFLNILLAARDAGVERVVLASSCAVYGDNPQLPCCETHSTSPVSPYAVSKLNCEHQARVFQSLYGLETVALRFFNIYGPRQDPNSQYAAAVPKFLTALTANKAPTIFGDGEQSREFTFVSDCVNAFLLAGTLERPGISGECFNIANGGPTTVNELVDVIRREVGVDIAPVYAPERPGEIRFSEANTAKARELLGFMPKWSLSQGIHETAKWFLAP